ncbi:restriction endonuclease subunit S [Paraclostridium sordellii]|uniref:restriction endonuclease subunit S n=1 Tax=Paraclostridium sordellii TaxID=1505 RepID=UPI0005E7A39F|nr:restriction endonuclease subunit S [Paeniclostridium sordellii]CEP85343.1 Restriction enzyme BgcI subunit beta [[Clostridium] sordellii] [Paeniclostridium sordellii]
MKLNFSKWKEFTYEDIFEIKKGFYNKKPEHTVNGNIPFLGATEKNNGVTEYYSLEDIENASKTGNEKNSPLSEKIFPPHALCVTNNGSVGFAYYQAEEFTCSHDVNPLYILDGEFNEFTALFVASVIEKDRYRWAYGRKWRPERMLKSQILLPATSEGTPDWEYMEAYIKKLHYKHITTKNKNKLTLNTSSYRKFTIDDIFNVKYGVNLELNNCDETTSDDVDAVNFVSRSRENNGVTAYIKRIPELEPQEAGLITVAAGGSSVLSTFVQNEPFYSGRDLYLLIPKEEMSIYTKLYLCTIITANKYKYSYGRQANKTLEKIELMLPTTSEGKPDYNYMEKYIKSLPYSDRILEE